MNVGLFVFVLLPLTEARSSALEACRKGSQHGVFSCGVVLTHVTVFLGLSYSDGLQPDSNGLQPNSVYIYIYITHTYIYIYTLVYNEDTVTVWVHCHHLSGLAAHQR